MWHKFAGTDRGALRVEDERAFWLDLVFRQAIHLAKATGVFDRESTGPLDYQTQIESRQH